MATEPNETDSPPTTILPPGIPPDADSGPTLPTQPPDTPPGEAIEYPDDPPPPLADDE